MQLTGISVLLQEKFKFYPFYLFIQLSGLHSVVQSKAENSCLPLGFLPSWFFSLATMLIKNREASLMA